MRHVRWIGFLVMVALAIMVSGAALAAPVVDQAGGVYTIQPAGADGCPPGPRPTLY
jgi:hypothetical protein